MRQDWEGLAWTTYGSTEVVWLPWWHCHDKGIAPSKLSPHRCLWVGHHFQWWPKPKQMKQPHRRRHHLCPQWAKMRLRPRPWWSKWPFQSWKCWAARRLEHRPVWVSLARSRLSQIDKYFVSEEKIPKTVMPKALPMPIACVKYLQTACWQKFSFLFWRWYQFWGDLKINLHLTTSRLNPRRGNIPNYLQSEIKDDGALATHSVDICERIVAAIFVVGLDVNVGDRQKEPFLGVFPGYPIVLYNPDRDVSAPQRGRGLLRYKVGPGSSYKSGEITFFR